MIKVSSLHSPRSVDEALALMSRDEYRPIAGGTDLIPQLRFDNAARILEIRYLGMNYIKEHEDEIEIGAACTHALLSHNPIIHKYIPLVGEAASLVGSQQIRNRGTVGGNIVNASPCADTVPALLIYDAEVVLISAKGQRRLKLAEFIERPYVTSRAPDELLSHIACKKNSMSTGYSFLKLGRRQAVNISRMTVAVSLQKDSSDKIRDVRISGGSVFPVPSRIKELEKMLEGQTISKKLFKDAGEFASELMIRESGYRWSTPYKQPVLAGLIERALTEAAGEVQSNQ
jgi:xanthine dehydrogenase FAD-binding subunit